MRGAEISRKHFIPRRMETTFIRAQRLRRNMTPPERIVWRYVRGRGLGGWKFRRQVPVGPFIVDFLCIDAGLIIEIDGPSHDERLAYDSARTDYLNRCGYHVLRISNRDVLQDIDAALSNVRRILDKALR